MSMLKKFNNLFINEEEMGEETIYEERETQTEKVEKISKEKPVNRVVNKPVNNSGKNDVILVEPLVFVDSKDILDNIKKNKVVIINISKLDIQTADRVLDFISGGIYAMDAKLKTIGDDIYLCVPKGVDVSGSFYEGE